MRDATVTARDLSRRATTVVSPMRHSIGLFYREILVNIDRFGDSRFSIQRQRGKEAIEAMDATYTRTVHYTCSSQICIPLGTVNAA